MSAYRGMVGLGVLTLVCLTFGCDGNGGPAPGAIQGTVTGTGRISVQVVLDKGADTIPTDLSTGRYAFAQVAAGYHEVMVQGRPGQFFSEIKPCKVLPSQTVTVDLPLIPDRGLPLLRVPDQLALPGSTISVPVSISDATGIAGMDITLTYDPSLVTATDASNAGLITSSFALQKNVTSGEIKVSMAHATGVSSGSGALVNITFLVNKGAQSGQSCALRLSSHTLYGEMTQAITHVASDAVFTVY